MEAQAQANADCLEEAEKLYYRAIEVSPFASLPYHLQARIAEERGDSQTADSQPEFRIPEQEIKRYSAPP